MHNPAHPGQVLKHSVFANDQMTVTEAASALGVSRITLSRLLNGRAGISAEMAVRLGRWLGTGPEVWINAQAQYDLWQAERALKRAIKRIEPLKQKGISGSVR
jgi:antitoxin HigA-1